MDALDPTLVNLIIFVLAIYVGYHVVWNVTPALHTPLAAALTEGGLARGMGVFAVALAAVNVFGGFLVTRRMLEMFKKKAPKDKTADKAATTGGHA
jgi:NAD(P) transhydrogenase subunit alpha